MKKIIALTTCVILFLSSCAPSLKMIGNVNMISTRNIDNSQNYVLIKSYAGGTDKELKKSRAQTLDAAINNTVMNTAGGEYLMNVKMYVVMGKYYAVVGDVWGLGTEKVDIHGWRVFDFVQWKNSGKTLTGVITDLKDANQCSVKCDGDGKIYSVKYDALTKNVSSNNGTQNENNQNGINTNSQDNTNQNSNQQNNNVQTNNSQVQNAPIQFSVGENVYYIFAGPLYTKQKTAEIKEIHQSTSTARIQFFNAGTAIIKEVPFSELTKITK